MIEYKRILFCTDFSEDANIAFLNALDLARKYESELHILHILHSSYAYCRHDTDEHPPGDAENVGALYDEEKKKGTLMVLKGEYEEGLKDVKNYVFSVKTGSPDVEIIRYAKENDIEVIVMGALGKSELDRIEHGSTVANVAKYAHCHVIAVRNPAKQFILPSHMY